MGEFFRGWRRKIGCVTLLMALFLMLGWIRSHHFVDEVAFSFNDQSDWLFGSLKNGLFAKFGHVHFSESTVRISSPAGLSFKTRAYDPDWPSDPLNWWRSESDCQICSPNSRMFGFRFAKVIAFEQAPHGFELWIIPYWSVTIPLILVSAYLLLTKPSKSDPANIIEPQPAEGA